MVGTHPSYIQLLFWLLATEIKHWSDVFNLKIFVPGVKTRTKCFLGDLWSYFVANGKFCVQIMMNCPYLFNDGRLVKWILFRGKRKRRRILNRNSCESWMPSFVESTYVCFSRAPFLDCLSFLTCQSCSDLFWLYFKNYCTWVEQ